MSSWHIRPVQMKSTGSQFLNLRFASKSVNLPHDSNLRIWLPVDFICTGLTWYCLVSIILWFHPILSRHAIWRAGWSYSTPPSLWSLRGAHWCQPNRVPFDFHPFITPLHWFNSRWLERTRHSTGGQSPSTGGKSHNQYWRRHTSHC